MIAVDWGTSSFRAYLLDSNGEILEQRHAAKGLLACAGQFEEVLAEQLHGWTDELILMAGMVGSRSGWKEAPYVDCPAGPEEVSRQLMGISSSLFLGRKIAIVPGLSHRPINGFPEVMRGEETQLFGLLASSDLPKCFRVCLPGTHSKWATVDDNKIVDFRTAMTGEMFALLKAHSLLGAQMSDQKANPVEEQSAFDLGVRSSASPGGVLFQLFSVRTRSLFSEIAPECLAPYLSGLLIGHELRGAALEIDEEIHLVGSDRLSALYERALQSLGVRVKRHQESLVTKGLFLLADLRTSSPLLTGGRLDKHPQAAKEPPAGSK